MTKIDTDEPDNAATQPVSHLLLDRLTEPDADLDDAFDRLLRDEDAEAGSVDQLESSSVSDEPRSLRARLRGDAMRTDEMTIATLLASVLEEYEDIERLIENLREHDIDPGAPLSDAVAVVSEEELSDPEALDRALAPLDAQSARFEHLFETAKGALDRLDPYELSRMPSRELIRLLQQEEKLRTIQGLVGFLRSLRRAADTFEALDLPSLHIRDYLTHLYRMGDWQEMSRLVSLLELAVDGLEEHEPPASPTGRAPEQAPMDEPPGLLAASEFTDEPESTDASEPALPAAHESRSRNAPPAPHAKTPATNPEEGTP